MFNIVTTRFNNKTFEENRSWREKNSWNGCIYGTPIIIKEDIPVDSNLFVIEMNNETNKIEGIGLIKNTLRLDKYIKIYSDGNYNRYTYIGNYRLDRRLFSIEELKVIELLDKLLFTGKAHCKRSQGIKLLPNHITNNSSKFNFLLFFRKVFENHKLI